MITYNDIPEQLNVIENLKKEKTEEIKQDKERCCYQHYKWLSCQYWEI